MESTRAFYSESIDAMVDALSVIRWHETSIVCVGTDRSCGDALGPIIGTKLRDMGVTVPIYGTLDEPVHAVNLAATIERIHTPYTLAIDACLGKFDHVGQVIFEHEPLRPGAGVKKALPEVGDWNMTGVVNVAGFMEYFVLQNTRLHMVMSMAEAMAQAVYRSICDGVATVPQIEADAMEVLV